MPKLKMHGAKPPFTDIYFKDNYNCFNLDIMHFWGILYRINLCQYNFGVLHTKERL